LPGILAAAKSVSAKLAGVEASESGVTYGEFATGTAVRRVKVAGTNHGTIIGSDEALNEIVAWLDNASGHAPRTEPPAFPVAPFGSGILWLLFLLVMPGLGEVMARLAPRSAEAEIAASRWNLGILVLSLAIALPLVGIAPPGVLMGLSDADVNVSFLALAGLFLIVILMLLNRIGSAPRSVTVSLSVALIGVLILFVLFGQVIAGLHGIGLTPEKTLLTICSAAFLLPFSFGFQTLTQSKSWTRALALRLAGRAIILAAILVGNSLGLFSFAGTIAFGMLLIGYVLIEIVLTGFYARSDNTLTGAGFEALTVAWLLAVMLPSNF
jgi:hypothetical protein